LGLGLGLGLGLLHALDDVERVADEPGECSGGGAHLVRVRVRVRVSDT
jgi:hypothetical protein